MFVLSQCLIRQQLSHAKISNAKKCLSSFCVFANLRHSQTEKKKKEKRGITVMWFKAQFVPGVMKVMGHGGYTTAARVSKIWKAGKYAEAVQDSDNCF